MAGIHFFSTSLTSEQLESIYLQGWGNDVVWGGGIDRSLMLSYHPSAYRHNCLLNLAGRFKGGTEIVVVVDDERARTQV